MDILQVPFNKLLGVARADGDSGFLLQLDDAPSFHNHLGAVHSGVLLAFAEIASGECLWRQFPELRGRVFAVVRKVEARFKKPLNGKIMSRGQVRQADADKFIADLCSRGQGLIAVAVEVIGGEGKVGMTSTIEWYVQSQAN
jgi:acyl-coenzyme A thioesterase PaaI-like protein